MNRDDAVNELKRTFRVLSDDVDEIQDLFLVNPSGALHRALIRAYSAFVEGTLYQFRQVVVHSAGSGNRIFTTEELMLLKELQVSLNKKGEVEAKDSYERFLPMLLFTLRQYAKLHGAKYEPDTGATGWSAMKRFVEVRNLLMHPKSTQSLEIDEATSKEVLKAVSWFHDTCITMFKECSKADDHYRQ